MSTQPVEPLDPQSDTGRRVAAELTALAVDVQERLAREAETDRAS